MAELARVPFAAASGKKSRAVETMAIDGPPDRKLDMVIAKQTRPAV